MSTEMLNQGIGNTRTLRQYAGKRNCEHSQSDISNKTKHKYNLYNK